MGGRSGSGSFKGIKRKADKIKSSNVNKLQPIEICKEVFNVQKLLWIFHNVALDEATKQRYADLMPLIKTDEQRWPYGELQVHYLPHSLGFGRIAPEEFGLIMMSRKIRQTICDDMYADIDFVNCHPMIYWNFIKLDSYEEVHTFKYFLDHRDDIIVECMQYNECTKEEAKQWFLKVLNGGDGRDDLLLTEFMEQYQKAIVAIHENTVKKIETQERYAHVRNFVIAKEGPDAFNLNCKIISCALLDVENQMREQLVMYLRKNKFDVSVHCYDGVMSYLKVNKENIFEVPDLLKNAANYVKTQLGVECELKFKSMMDEKIILPTELPHTYADFRALVIPNDLTYEVVKSKFEENNFFCYSNVKYYTEGPTFTHEYSPTEFAQKWSNIQTKGTSPKGDEILEKFILKWMDDPLKRAYTVIGLYPPGSEMPENPKNPQDTFYCYSTWKGLHVQSIKPDGKDHTKHVDLFRNHLLYLCSGDLQYRSFFEKCLKLIFVWPGRKIDLVLAFKACQGGEGKNTIWEYVAEIIGRQYCYHTANHDRDWFGDFNEGIRNKIWVHMEEMSKEVLKKYQKQFLAYVTSKEDVINLKGGKKIMVPSYCNYFITFNSQGLEMFPGLNRRLWVHEMFNHVMKDKDYYDEIYAAMKNQQGLRAVYDWIMENVDIENFKPADHRPMTPYMSRLFGREGGPQDRLGTWLYDKFISLFQDKIVPNEYKVQVSEFHKDYVLDCKPDGHVVQVQTFSTRVGELFGQSGAMEKRLNKGRQYFMFNLNQVIKHLERLKWLQMSDLGWEEKYDMCLYKCHTPCMKQCNDKMSRLFADEDKAVQYFIRQKHDVEHACSCGGFYSVTSNN